VTDKSLSYSEVFDYMVLSLWLCNHSLYTSSSTGALVVLCVAFGLLVLRSYKSSFTYLQ